MQCNIDFSKRLALASLTAVALAAGLDGAQAAKGFSTLHSFCQQANCTDGSSPSADLIADSAGNFYGTTYSGGAYGYGSVFKLAPDGSETVVYSFCAQPNCNDGEYPSGPVTLDSAGNLYGTTITNGGGYGGGVVFKITPDGTETVLHTFCAGEYCGDETGYPSGGVVMDSAGNLYGAAIGHTYIGLRSAAYEISPDGTETVLADLPANNDPVVSRLTLDRNGNLYGTTSNGGSSGDGAVYELRPPIRGQTQWTSTTLYSFCSQANCSDGFNPEGGVVLDRAGNLYGTTQNGGNLGQACGSGCGTVFKLAPDGTETVLYAFCSHANCTDGRNPQAGLHIGGYGRRIFGSTAAGGGDDAGTVFSIRSGAYNVLHSFSGSDGADPIAGVIPESGYLYGTAAGGGADSGGTVFKLGKVR